MKKIKDWTPNMIGVANSKALLIKDLFIAAGIGLITIAGMIETRGVRFKPIDTVKEEIKKEINKGLDN